MAFAATQVVQEDVVCNLIEQQAAAGGYQERTLQQVEEASREQAELPVRADSEAGQGAALARSDITTRPQLHATEQLVVSHQHAALLLHAPAPA